MCNTSFNFQVEEIAYMMIKPVGDIKTRDWPLTTLPVGFTLSYIVTYHDNIGLQFDAVRSQLKFRASRFVVIYIYLSF